MKLKAISLLTVLVLGAGGMILAETPQSTKATLTDTVTAPKPSDTTKLVVPTVHKVIAYYFHGNKRCVSCRKIEAYTKEAIDSAFGGDLKSGALEWRVVNTDSAQNEHYWTDYKLYTKSVVLSDLHGGKETRWKNLEKVWELLGGQKEFAAYIESELVAFLDKTK